MGLVKPEISGTSNPEIVLVRVAADALKTVFELADRLRDAGYIAEIDLDGKKTAARWTIEVGGKTPAFTLIDKAQRTGFANIDEIIKGLGAKRGS